MNTYSTAPQNISLIKRKDGGVHRQDRDIYVTHECVWFVLTQAVRAVYGKAHEDDVSVWIGEGSQPVIVLLTCCVPESQLHLTNTVRARKGEKLIKHFNPDQRNFHNEARE